MDRRSGSPRALRANNKRVVLERLLEAPDGLTRPELARLVDLTVPAIASLVAGSDDDLSAVLDESVAAADSPRARGNGPRPKVIRIKKNVGHVVGIVLNHTQIRVALGDLYGNYEPDRHTEPKSWDVEHDLHGAIAYAVKAAWQLAKDRTVEPEEIAAIGVAIAAPVHVFDGALPNERRGLLRMDLGPGHRASPWLNIDPLAALTNHLAALPDGDRWSAIDLHVDNDANLGALAELKAGAGRGKQNILYVSIQEAGIGAGLVFNGFNYRGAGGIAGEFGHVVIEPDRDIECRRCGHPCVEAVIGSMLGCHDHVCDPPLDQLVRAALDEDRKAIDSITQAAKYLGRALAGFVTVLNLDRILIGGPFPAQAYSLIIPPIQAELDRFTIAPVARDYVLGLGSLRENAVLEGAIWLALKRTRVDYLIRRAVVAKTPKLIVDAPPAKGRTRLTRSRANNSPSRS